MGGKVIDRHNYVASFLKNDPRFADPASYDFRLTPESPAAILDGGVPPGRSAAGYDLTPKLEYVLDASGKSRPVSGALDLGAFEYPGREAETRTEEITAQPALQPPTRTPHAVRGSSRAQNRATMTRRASAKKKGGTYPARSIKASGESAQQP